MTSISLFDLNTKRYYHWIRSKGANTKEYKNALNKQLAIYWMIGMILRRKGFVLEKKDPVEKEWMWSNAFVCSMFIYNGNGTYMAVLRWECSTVNAHLEIPMEPKKCVWLWIVNINEVMLVTLCIHRLLHDKQNWNFTASTEYKKLVQSHGFFHIVFAMRVKRTFFSQ